MKITKKNKDVCQMFKTFPNSYPTIFGCKAQTKIKRQIPEIVTIVIVTSTIAKRSIEKKTMNVNCL
jgi:hypothetical protein